MSVILFPHENNKTLQSETKFNPHKRLPYGQTLLLNGLRTLDGGGVARGLPVAEGGRLGVQVVGGRQRVAVVVVVRAVIRCGRQLLVLNVGRHQTAHLVGRGPPRPRRCSRRLGSFAGNGQNSYY